jgi:membrane fusion protein (multidrug efflux system)
MPAFFGRSSVAICGGTISTTQTPGSATAPGPASIPHARANVLSTRATSRIFRLFLKRLESRSTLLGVLLVAAVVGIALATIRNGTTWGEVSGVEATDDAYVRADQIALSSHIAGYIETVPVGDNQTVHQGQLIATIRDDDYRARVAAAQAALDAGRSAVEVLTAQLVVQHQKAASASADVRAADAVLTQSRLQGARQRGLIDDGTTSQRELEAAEGDEARLAAVRDQKASDLAAAQQTLQVIDRQVEESQQAVKARQAALELAGIDLGYTRIVAPVSGQLSTRGALPGEYVTPGSRLGLLVPLPDVWIVANFREAQMARMVPGQSVEVTVDSVPGITFHGTVDSVGPASGALQALLPPDNATGNFTKVAQRFAVKIVLAPGQVGIGRLRPGMSALASVQVGSGKPERSAP